MTMDLFKIYKKVKIEDDKENCDKRFSGTKPYNLIPVIPSSLKRKE